MAKDFPKSVSQAEFGRVVGLSRQRIGQLVKEGLPVNSAGRVVYLDAIEWMRANVAGSAVLPDAGEASEDEPGDIVAARLAKLIEETRLLKIEIAEREGNLVNRDEIRRALTAFARLIRDKWVNFPNRYGLEVAHEIGADPVKLAAALDRRVRLQLDEIANVKPTLPE